MTQIATAFYDGQKLTIATPQDEKALRDLIINTVKSYVNVRRHWLVSSQGSHKMKVITACQELGQFVDIYKHYSMKAVAKRIVAMEAHLYALMPNPEKKQADWCFKIQTIVAISNAYLNQYGQHLYQRQ